VVAKTEKEKEKHHIHPAKEKAQLPEVSKTPQPKPSAAQPDQFPALIAPPATTNLAAMPVQPGATNLPPIALPESVANGTNALLPAVPVAAVAAAGDSAFAARDIAEQSLPPADIAPTGRAELLRIVGDRTAGETTPANWKYYFFDRHASGNARIVTVTDGRAVKTGEDLADFATPYEEGHVMPEDKLLVDSTQALQIAQGLVPGVNVESAEYTLMQQKNSEPMWKVTLWTRNASGEDRRLGDVTLRAETGAPYSIKLTQ
jgi:hypothetical protein